MALSCLDPYVPPSNLYLTPRRFLYSLAITPSVHVVRTKIAPNQSTSTINLPMPS